MKCPCLSELPAPPPGKTGWPWTEETPVTIESINGHHDRITIVTPCFNSGRFLEETIRSVLLQGYPDLEYIVIDGGSNDDSKEIIRKYEKWITFWQSEKDRGWPDAINKGFSRATGTIRAWMPASDSYLPSALVVANRYLRNSDLDIIYGESLFVDEMGVNQGMSRTAKNLRHLMIYGRGMPVQCAIFWKTHLHEKVGLFKPEIRIAADREWFLRACVPARSRWIPEITCSYRQHAGQLSASVNVRLREEFEAWRDTLRANHISQFQIICGALVFVPLMHYRTGGLKRLFSIPRISCIKHILFRKN